MKSILVIDSDPITASLTVKFLQNYSYEVAIARNGKDALDMVHSPSYDLVLADTQLNGLSGMDVLKLMRRCFVDVPFAFLASNDDPATRMEAKDLGAVLFVSKRNEYITLPHVLDSYFYQIKELVA